MGSFETFTYSLHAHWRRARAYKNFIEINVDRENHMLPRRRYVSPTRHQAHFTVNTIDVRAEWVSASFGGCREHEASFAAKWDTLRGPGSPYSWYGRHLIIHKDAAASVNESWPFLYQYAIEWPKSWKIWMNVQNAAERRFVFVVLRARTNTKDNFPKFNLCVNALSINRLMNDEILRVAWISGFPPMAQEFMWNARLTMAASASFHQCTAKHTDTNRFECFRKKFSKFW